MKKPSLGGTIGFHMDQAGNSVGAECASFLYISLTEKPSDVGCVCFFHLMLNRTFFELNAE